MTKAELSHVDARGKARMVDVGDKDITERIAVAEGQVRMLPATLELIKANALKKGDALTVAQVAGVQGAKRTSELIPFCHPLSLDHIAIEFEIQDELPGVKIRATAKTRGKTGVEMEALTAVSVAALTVYDMAKAAEKGMHIENVHLVKKTGGKSGEWVEGQSRD